MFQLDHVDNNLFSFLYLNLLNINVNGVHAYNMEPGYSDVKISDKTLQIK